MVIHRYQTEEGWCAYVMCHGQIVAFLGPFPTREDVMIELKNRGYY